MQKDRYFLKKTFKLARKGEGSTSPNPMVGAVFTKNNKIISTGYHRRAGAPHAEIEALEKIAKSARGTTLYINLEPCCCWGRTPPCVDEIITAGVRRVVVSNLDPNPMVRGRSIAKLRRAGIRVDLGLFSREGEQLNQVFFKNMEDSMPFVAVKCAMTLDGKTATRGGRSQWITGEKTRLYGRRLRDKYDAVLVGINTVLKDDPVLDGRKKKIVKVVIDPKLKIPLNARLLETAKNRVMIVASAAVQIKKKSKLFALENKARVIFAREKNGALDLRSVLKRLYRNGICSVYVEGGAFTAGKFFDCRCVDKVYFFVAPKIFGGSAALPAIGGKGVERIKDAAAIERTKVKKIAEDLLIEGYPRFQREVKRKKEKGKSKCEKSGRDKGEN